MDPAVPLENVIRFYLQVGIEQTASSLSFNMPVKYEYFRKKFGYVKLTYKDKRGKLLTLKDDDGAEDFVALALERNDVRFFFFFFFFFLFYFIFFFIFFFFFFFFLILA